MPGLHEPRTGDAAEDVLDWAPPEAEVMFEIYFDSRCLHCAEYIEAAQAALELINAGELSGKVAFVAVNAGQQTDREVKNFANKHKVTFPVLAGATEEDIQQRKIGGVPTTYFWLKRNGKWGIIDRAEGGTEAENIVQVSELFYTVILHPEIHDIKTEKKGESLLDFVAPEVGIFYAVYVDTDCAACVEQVKEMFYAFLAAQTHPYGRMVDFLIVNGKAESDKAMQEFIDDAKNSFWLDHPKMEPLPINITVLAGVPEEGRGIPLEVTPDQGASTEIQNLPAIILFYETEDGWRTWGVYDGGILLMDRMVYFFESYAAWRMAEGF